MYKVFCSKLTFSNVIAMAALFVALGGSALAVSRNSVGPRQLRANAVTAVKVRNNAITTPKLRNAAVTNAKLRDGAVSTSKIADNAVTGDKVDESTLTGVTAKPSGPAGGSLTGTYPNPALADNSVTSAKIGAGQVRASDLGTLTIRSVTDTAIATGTSDLIIVPCNSGEIAIGGGGQWSGAFNQDVQVQALVPTGGQFFQATGRNNSGGTRDFTAYATCLQAG